MPWALFEAAMNASRRRSPDHPSTAAVKDRHDGKLAAIAGANSPAAATTFCATLDPDIVYAIPA